MTEDRETGTVVLPIPAAAVGASLQSSMSDLISPGEAALLAAVLPNPHRLRADAPSPYVRERQQWVLQQMGQLGGSSYLASLD